MHIKNTFYSVNDSRTQCYYDSEVFRHDNEELTVEPFEQEIHEMLDFVDGMTIPMGYENANVRRDNGVWLLEMFVFLIRDYRSKGLLRFRVEQLQKHQM